MSVRRRAFSLGLCVACGCGSMPDDGEPPGDAPASSAVATDQACTLTSLTAASAKARLIGYIVGHGTATTTAYHLAVASSALADHVASLVATAGLKGVTRTGNAFTVPIAAVGDYFVPATWDTSPPIDPPALLASAPAVVAYDPQQPGCGLRHFLAALMEVDGALPSPAVMKQAVAIDAHASVRAAWVAAWKALGAASAHVSGSAVVVLPGDDAVAQCLPNRDFARVPGGKPAAGLCAGIAPPPVPPPGSAKRSKTAWPFSRYSIWNMPIGTGAQYVPAGIAPPTVAKIWGTDTEFISLDPSAPVKLLNGQYDVRVDPTLASNGAKNGCTELVAANDTNRIYQGQWLTLQAGGDPSWPHDYSFVKQGGSSSLDDPANQLVALNGAGRWGCHGGSALSGLGGAIKKGELDGPDPIRHVVEYQPYCYLYCSPHGSNGLPYRWPAYRADGYALDPSSTTSDGRPRYYNGHNPELQMGSLLALLPSFNVAALHSPHARKLAQALKDYGAYIVDDAARDTADWTVEAGAAFDDGGSFSADIVTLLQALNVVKNNGPTAVGGGGNPRVCYAPPFADATPDGITANPNGAVSQPAGCP